MNFNTQNWDENMSVWKIHYGLPGIPLELRKAWIAWSASQSGKELELKDSSSKAQLSSLPVPLVSLVLCCEICWGPGTNIYHLFHQ